MKTTEFHQLADLILNDLFEYAQDLADNITIDDIVEVELHDGIVNIDFEDNKKYFVINKHEASKQIWLSSPVSGASYFEYKDSWLPIKGAADKELISFLKQELEFLHNSLT